MKDIAIIGKGGFGRELRMLIDQINSHQPLWHFVGYFDDDMNAPIDGYPQLGKIRDINECKNPLDVVLGIGSPQTKEAIIGSIINENIQYPNLIHPDLVSDNGNFALGVGNVICSGNVISTNVTLGDFNSINLACTIGHDVKIGSYCSINPGANISGNVDIDDLALIGTGSCIIQGLSIGEGAVVGAGAVALRKVEEGITVIGNPARPMRKSKS